MTAATEDRMSSLGDEDLVAALTDGREFGTPDAGTGLFRSAGEPRLDVGHDGDDIGRSKPDQEIRDMLSSGHGFLIRAAPSAPKTLWRVRCEVCGGAIPPPGDDPDWVCQYDETQQASPICNCAWCLCYQDYLAGRYKPQGGRPRKRCGLPECDRKAKTQAQKLNRLQKRREKLLSECGAESEEPPSTVHSLTAALSRIDEVPREWREGVRARLEARLALLSG